MSSTTTATSFCGVALQRFLSFLFGMQNKTDAIICSDLLPDIIETEAGLTGTAQNRLQGAN